MTQNLPFDHSEYAERLARTRAAMARAGIEVLLTSDPSNMAWLTGYDGWSFYVHQGVLIGPEGDPVWWGRGMDAVGARRTVDMSEARIRGYADDYVQNPEKHPMADLAALLSDMGWQGLTLGVEMDNYYFSAAAYRALLAQDIKLADATGLVNWQRAIKSAAEIGFMRRAARIVEAMHATIREVAEPGLPKYALVAEITRRGILGADGHWGDYPAIVPMCPSGLDATAPRQTSSGKPPMRLRSRRKRRSPWRGRATPAAMWRGPSSAASGRRASTRTGAAAMPSGSATRPTGASARCPSGQAIPRSSRRA